MALPNDFLVFCLTVLISNKPNSALPNSILGTLDKIIKMNYVKFRQQIQISGIGCGRPLDIVLL